jgi:hypothetical protein
VCTCMCVLFVCVVCVECTTHTSHTHTHTHTHTQAPRKYDLVFLGDCCGIADKDRPSQPPSSRVGSWLFRTARASRCSNAYLISRRGIEKMLAHVPVWCSLDWMMNAAKFALDNPVLQTQVYVMEPPMFVEGSKTGAVITTVEPGSPFGPPL